MRKLFFFLFVFFQSVCLVNAQGGKEKITQLITKFKSDEDLKHAVYSYCVLNASDGKMIAEYNSQLSLVPASTLKTLTTGAALGILGKNFTYETTLLFNGELKKETGEINGNLIVKGSGDPTLGSKYFKKKDDTTDVIDEFISALKKKGIKKINGKIIADNFCFENDLPGTWIWSDIGNYFGAPPNGLSYIDNKYSLFFKSGSNGSKTEIISQTPADFGIEFDNNVTAGGSDDNAFIYGSPGEKKRVIKGTIPANQNNYEVEGALGDPALYFVMKLKEKLIRNNILVSGECCVQDEKTKGTTLLCTHKSPPLEKIVYYTNMKSNNHYAESLLRTIAFKKNGYGTSSGGTNLVTNYWKEKGVDISSLFMNDGSGLSRSNAISTSTQAAVLSKIFNDSTTYNAFNLSLPVSGVSGGMAGMGKSTCAEGNMRAKSGYITRARAYCGYVKNSAGKELCFSIIFNNYSCSPKEVKTKIESLIVLFCQL
jgi:serine-type D-Ala-D-Ala carboxypeptidase/endopeptidase (penicillin-binding protein 4)